ncbi:hypothetical protein [Azospirillum sp. sgz301742]
MPGLPSPDDRNAQIRAVRREIMRRRREYPHQIKAGLLRDTTAQYELDVMQAVLRTLTTLRECQDDGDVPLARRAEARAA